MPSDKTFVSFIGINPAKPVIVDNLLLLPDQQGSTAAEVINKADSGKNIAEEIAIGGKSDFATASTAVVSAIMQMRKKVGWQLFIARRKINHLPCNGVDAPVC